MKNILAISLVIAFLASCGGGGDDIDSTGNGFSNGTVAEGSNVPGATTAAESSVFLASAYQDGAAEIALSELALDKATSEEVRVFAQRMIDDHTQANEEILALAQANDITLPTGLTDEANTALQALTNLAGLEFDQAYMEHNVVVHERDVQLFRGQVVTTGADDAASEAEIAIRIFAANTLPVLQAHLLAAKGLSGAIDPSAFLMNLHQDGSGEILLSTLALEKASDPEVRAYAQKMIADHTAANNQIAQLAQTKGITLPTQTSVEHRAVYEDIVDMEGADFEKAYMNHNVLVHELAVAQAEAQAEHGTDTEIRGYAATVLPTLSEHLDAATQIYETIEPGLLFSGFQDGLGEILLSKLALQKSADSQVRELAQTIIDDHVRIRADLLQLAQDEGAALPRELSPEQWRAYLELLQLSGGEFDEAYIERNVTVRDQDVQLIQQQSAEVSDAEVRALVNDALAVISGHVALAQDLARSAVGAATAPGAY